MTALTADTFAEFCARYAFEPHPTGVMVSRTAGRKELGLFFAAAGFQRGAEIGVWQGEYSAYLCQAVPGLHLTCVDPWQQYRGYVDPKNEAARLEDAYQKACTALAPYDCAIQRTTSKKAAAKVPDGSLDFVYCDGNHGKAFVLADLDAWVPKVRSGGAICGHDYELVPRRKILQVKFAVDEWRRSHDVPGPLYVLANDKTPSFMWVKP